MGNLKFTKKAVLDLDEIWAYTLKEWSEGQADKYYNELIKFCKVLSDTPNLGKVYSIIHPNLLGFKVNKHIIFYRILNSDLIEITRILHGKMDLKVKFNE